MAELYRDKGHSVFSVAFTFCRCTLDQREVAGASSARLLTPHQSWPRDKTLQGSPSAGGPSGTWRDALCDVELCGSLLLRFVSSDPEKAATVLNYTAGHLGQQDLPGPFQDTCTSSRSSAPEWGHSLLKSVPVLLKNSVAEQSFGK